MFGLEKRAGGFAIVTSYLRLPIGLLALDAAKINRAATGLSEPDATRVIYELETWYQSFPVVSRSKARKYGVV
jgi:hypothetical protein